MRGVGMQVVSRGDDSAQAQFHKVVYGMSTIGGGNMEYFSRPPREAANWIESNRPVAEYPPPVHLMAWS